MGTAERTARPEVLRHTAARCWCGHAMPAPRSTGRRRISHDAACSRSRDRLLQQVHRRMEWLAAWRAEIGRGAYPRARVRHELRTIRGELATLERTLAGQMPEAARSEHIRLDGIQDSSVCLLDTARPEARP
jgi:hypothetical protein